jgi:hypothetical protein
MSNHPVAYRALSGSAIAPGTLALSSVLNAGIISAAALIAGRIIARLVGL